MAAAAIGDEALNEESCDLNDVLNKPGPGSGTRPGTSFGPMLNALLFVYGGVARKQVTASPGAGQAMETRREMDEEEKSWGSPLYYLFGGPAECMWVADDLNSHG